MDLSFSENQCRECGKPLLGRLDKKYCDDQCRSNFNNRNKRLHEKMIVNTNSQLRKNRTILKTLCPTGKATVRRSVLRDMGFDFQLFTGIFSTKGSTYYFSYEYAFTPQIDQKGVEKVVIVQRQNYMENKFDPWKYLTLKNLSP